MIKFSWLKGKTLRYTYSIAEFITEKNMKYSRRHLFAVRLFKILILYKKNLKPDFFNVGFFLVNSVLQTKIVIFSLLFFYTFQVNK